MVHMFAAQLCVSCRSAGELLATIEAAHSNNPAAERPTQLHDTRRCECCYQHLSHLFCGEVKAGTCTLARVRCVGCNRDKPEGQMTVFCSMYDEQKRRLTDLLRSNVGAAPLTAEQVLLVCSAVTSPCSSSHTGTQQRPAMHVEGLRKLHQTFKNSVYKKSEVHGRACFLAVQDDTEYLQYQTVTPAMLEQVQHGNREAVKQAAATLQAMQQELWGPEGCTLFFIVRDADVEVSMRDITLAICTQNGNGAEDAQQAQEVMEELGVHAPHAPAHTPEADLGRLGKRKTSMSREEILGRRLKFGGTALHLDVAEADNIAVALSEEFRYKLLALWYFVDPRVYEEVARFICEKRGIAFDDYFNSDSTQRSVPISVMEEAMQKWPGQVLRKEQFHGTKVSVPAAWAHMVLNVSESFKVATEKCSKAAVAGMAWARAMMRRQCCSWQTASEHLPPEYVRSIEALMSLL